MPPPAPRPLAVVVDTVNRNNARLDQPIYVPIVDVNASLTDDAGKRQRFTLRGRLVMQRPASLWMQLDHSLEADQMRLGSNEREYWLVIRGDFSTMWWGKHEHAGKTCVRSLRLDPTRLADALGLAMLPERGMLGPYRYCNPRFDELMYGRHDPLGGLRVDRAYLVDRFEPYLLRGVTYYDAMGRPEVLVSLDELQPLGEGGPLLPRRVSLTWFETKDWMRMELSGVQIRENVSARTFERPTQPPAGIRTMEQIDADCDALNRAEPAPASRKSDGE